jgi:agmatinase
MSRIGNMYGPDTTFLGVRPASLTDPASHAGADVVIVGAPFDGGTSHRPGARFGPQAIRGTDYLPHDASRRTWRWASTRWPKCGWWTWATC